MQHFFMKWTIYAFQEKIFITKFRFLLMSVVALYRATTDIQKMLTLE